MVHPKTERTRVFISYSHQDQDWLRRLRTHLVPLEREKKIDIWDDTEIKAGSAWKEEIEQSLKAAKVAILLVSADFLASDFIHTNELPELLKAAKQEGAFILPIVVKPCRFSSTLGLSEFQAVNSPSKPLDRLSSSEQEEVFVDVANRVEEIFHSIPISKLDQPEKAGALQPEKASKLDQESTPIEAQRASGHQTGDESPKQIQKGGGAARNQRTEPALMDTKNIIITAAEVVAFLFVAFSGFLTNIAPPEADANFAIGISSSFALIILLFAMALSRNLPKKKYLLAWLIAAMACFIVAAIFAFKYKNDTEKLTFLFPPESKEEKYVKGTEMTPLARAHKDKTGKNDSEVVAALGGLPSKEKVWTPESIARSKQVLVIDYVVLIVSIAGAIFALTEGIIRKPTQRRV